MTFSKFDIHSLTPAERLELIGQIWDSLEAGAVPLTQVQRQDLARRLETPGEWVSWAEAQRLVWGRPPR